MKQILVVYDDSAIPENEIRTITGDKSYGDTIFKRVTLANRMKEALQQNKQVLAVYSYRTAEEKQTVNEKIKELGIDCSVLHLFSNYGIKDSTEFQTILEKAEYINKDYVVFCEGETVLFMYENPVSYLRNQENLATGIETDMESIVSEAFTDLSKVGNFLTFITGGFDARFFNALEGDEYTVTKKSIKIDKIKSEYNFYYLLPDNMKMWFVMPFDYKEDGGKASYTMERYHMTDIAIRYVHGAVSTDEFKGILKKLFYFIGIRGIKEVSEEEYRKVAHSLYVDKVKQRMADLKKLPEYDKYDKMVQAGTCYNSIEEVVEKYENLYESHKEKVKGKFNLCIGHGDLCFSNILYSKDASILRLIDPKGAQKEEDLYTNPYYDLAKLSHSICGCYDFFNSGLFQITMESNLQFKLSVDTDNSEYIAIFKQFLQANGFDYALVRLYEASLFLSMLPYHMDNPAKVFGFLLNAINVLSEVERCSTKE